MATPKKKETKSTDLRIRLSPRLKKTFRRAAARQRESVAEWLRRAGERAL